MSLLNKELLIKLDKLVLGAVGNPTILPENWDYERVYKLIDSLAEEFLSKAEISSALSISDEEPKPNTEKEFKNHHLLSLYFEIRNKYFENQDNEDSQLTKARREIIEQATQAAQDEQSRLEEIEAEIGKAGLKQELDLAKQRLAIIKNKYILQGADIQAAQILSDPQAALPSLNSLLITEKRHSDPKSDPTLPVLVDIAEITDSVKNHPYVAAVRQKVADVSPQTLNDQQTDLLSAAILTGITANNPSLRYRILDQANISIDLPSQNSPLPFTDSTVKELTNLLSKDTTITTQQQAAKYLENQTGISTQEANNLVQNISTQISQTTEDVQITDTDIISPLLSQQTNIPISPEEAPSQTAPQLINKVTHSLLLADSISETVPSKASDLIKTLNIFDQSEQPTSPETIRAFLKTQKLSSQEIETTINNFQNKQITTTSIASLSQPALFIYQTLTKNPEQTQLVLNAYGFSSELIREFISKKDSLTSPEAVQAFISTNTTINSTPVSIQAAKIAAQKLNLSPDHPLIQSLNNLQLSVSKDELMSLGEQSKLTEPQLEKLKSTFLEQEAQIAQSTIQNQTIENITRTAKSSPQASNKFLQSLGLNEPDAQNLTTILATSHTTSPEIFINNLPISPSILAAKHSLSKHLDGENLQNALKEIDTLPAREDIPITTLEEIYLKHGGTKKLVSQTITEYIDTKNKPVNLINNTTPALTPQTITELKTIYTNTLDLKQALSQAQAAISKDTSLPESSPIVIAQAQSTLKAFQETHITTLEQTTQKIIVQSTIFTKDLSRTEISAQIQKIAPEVHPRIQAELSYEIHRSLQNNTDLNQTINTFFSNNSAHVDLALRSSSQIPTLPSPITYTDRVVFATNTALSTSAITLNPETVSKIVQAHASLSPQEAQEKTIELLQNYNTDGNITPKQLGVRISTNIRAQLEKTSPEILTEKVFDNHGLKIDADTQKIVSEILSDQKLNSIRKNQKILEIISGKTENVNPQVITTSLTTAYQSSLTYSPIKTDIAKEISLINNNPKLSLQEKITQTKAVYAAQSFNPLTKDQLSSVKQVVNSTLSIEEKTTHVNQLLKSYGLSTQTSHFLTSQIVTPKIVNTEIIVRKTLEPKSPDALLNLLKNPTPITKKDMLMGSLRQSGLSPKNSDLLVSDLPSLQLVTSGLPALSKQQFLIDYIQKNYDPKFSPTPSQIKSLENSFNLFTPTKIQPNFRPGFSENLIQNYNQYSKSTQKLLDSVFQNEKLYNQALGQFLGSPEIAEKFTSLGLHKSVYVLADQATRTDRILSGRDINFDRHFKNSLDTHLRFLQENGNLSSKNIEVIKTLRGKITDPNFSMDSYKTLFQFPLKDFKLFNSNGKVEFAFTPKFLKQIFSDSKGKPSEFFAFITNKTNFALSEHLNQFSTIKRAFTNPDLKSIAQNLLGSKFNDFVRNFSLQRLNPLNQYTSTIIMKGRSSLLFRGGSAIYTKLAATKFGSAVLKPLTAAANKIVAQVAAKLGLQIVGSAAPIIGNIIAFVIGFIGDIFEKLFGQYLSKIKKSVGEGLAGAGIGLSMSIGAVPTAIGGIIVGFITTIGAVIIGVVASIVTPLFISTLAVPTIIALFLFITTNSSYVIPPTQYTFGSPSAPGVPAIILPPDPTGNSPRCWPFRGADANRLFVSRGPSQGHNNAIDIASGEQNGRTGTVPVYATHNGRVEVRPYASGGYGVHIYLYGSDFHTRYAHLDRIVVPNGSIIGRGTLVGYLGNTGNSTGAHLHYEIQPSNSYNVNSIVPTYITGAPPIVGGFAGDPGSCGQVTPSISVTP